MGARQDYRSTLNAHLLPANPLARVEKHPIRPSGDIQVFPKSGKVRAVPLAPDVASSLAALGRREHWTGDDDLVFVGESGDHLNGSALRRRYKTALTAAGLRPLRFHDLRHTFGTRMIAKVDYADRMAMPIRPVVGDRRRGAGCRLVRPTGWAGACLSGGGGARSARSLG